MEIIFKVESIAELKELNGFLNKALAENAVKMDYSAPYPEFVSNLDFTVRTERRLKSELISTTRELITWTELELLKTPGLGLKSLREIKSVLKSYNLYLGTTDP